MVGRLPHPCPRLPQGKALLGMAAQVVVMEVPIHHSPLAEPEMVAKQIMTE
jgi:hypothetical protein